MRVSAAALELIAAQYALGALAPGVRRAIDKRRKRDSVLAAEIDRWEQRLADFADTGATLSAERSEQVWRQVSAELQWTPAGSAKNDAVGPTRPPLERLPWWRTWRWQPWAGAVTAGVIAIAVYPWLQSRQSPTRAPMISSAPATSPLPAQLPSSVEPEQLPSVQQPLVQQPLVQQASVQQPGEQVASAVAPAARSPDADAMPVLRHRYQHAVDHGAPKRANADAATAVASTSASRSPVVRANENDHVPQTASKTEVAGVKLPTAAVESTPNANADDHARPMLATRGMSRAGHGPGGVYAGVLTSDQGQTAWRLRLDVAAAALKVAVVAPQDPGKTATFQLWAVPNDGGPPQALGAISGRSDVTLTLDSRLSRAVRMAQTLGVSVEPGDSSAPAAPSGAFGFTGQVQ